MPLFVRLSPAEHVISLRRSRIEALLASVPLS